MAIGMWIETHQNKNRKLGENSSFQDSTCKSWIKGFSESNTSKFDSSEKRNCKERNWPLGLIEVDWHLYTGTRIFQDFKIWKGISLFTKQLNPHHFQNPSGICFIEESTQVLLGQRIFLVAKKVLYFHLSSVPNPVQKD